MMTHVEHSQSSDGPYARRVYSPDILPRIQSLLAALADIDLAYERSLEIIKTNPLDDSGRERLIADLHRRHRERRAPYVQELTALKERIKAAFD